MKEFRPDLVGMPSTNGTCASGDGMKVGRERGMFVCMLWLGREDG